MSSLFSLEKTALHMKVFKVIPSWNNCPCGNLIFQNKEGTPMFFEEQLSKDYFALCIENLFEFI